MIYPKFAAALLFVFAFSLSAFSQQNPSFINTEKEAASALKTDERAAVIKADILKEIKNLGSQQQASFYGTLAYKLWEHDEKEARLWMIKAVETAASPSIKFEDEGQKLTFLWNLLSATLEKDVELSNQIIARIRKIKIDETNRELLKKTNKTYSLIAQQIFTRSENRDAAFEFAMLSLKKGEPAIDLNSVEFLASIKFSKDPRAELYFTEFIKSAAAANKLDDAITQVLGVTKYKFRISYAEMLRRTITDQEIKTFLEYMLPQILSEAEEIAAAKKDKCPIIKSWGKTYLDEYRKLWSEKLATVENAIAVCQNAAIEAGEKPDFKRPKLSTSREYYDYAVKQTDSKIREVYLWNAANQARNEENYKFTLEIANSEYEKSHGLNWLWMKIEALEKLIEKNLAAGDFAGVSALLEQASPEIRPYVIKNSLYSLYRLKEDQKIPVLNLLRQARADFNKIEQMPAELRFYATNPTDFAHLVTLYVKFGYYDEAIATHEEAVKSLNRLSAKLQKPGQPAPLIWRTSSYSSFTNSYPPQDVEFIDLYFDRIYKNIGQIENSSARLSERIDFLSKILQKVPNPTLIPGIPN